MLKGLFFLSILVLLGACTPSAEPPSINSPLSPINIEACKNASMSLRQFTAPGVRALVNCLNGTNHALQPYKDFLDSLDDDDLDTLLEVNNKHVFRDAVRVNQALDLLDRMHAKGHMKSLFKDVQVLVENGVTDKILPVLSRFFESDKDPGNMDPALHGVNEYVSRLIDDGHMTDLLVAAGNSFGGLRARIIGLLLFQPNTSSVLKISQMVDLLSDQLMAGFDDGAVHALLTHLSDPAMEPGLGMRALTDDEQQSLGDLLTFLPTGSTTGGTRMERMRRVIVGSDRPLVCFSNGTRTRRADNLLRVIGSESVKRKPGIDTDKFYLQTVPILILTSKDTCDYSNDILDNIDIDKEIARFGYGDGKRALFQYLISGNRFEESAKALKSLHLPALAPVMEEMAVRGATPFMVDMLTKDMTAKDAFGAADALAYLTAEDLRGDALVKWLRQNLSASAVASALQMLQSLPESSRGLVGLSLALARAPDQTATLRELKNGVEGASFSGGYEKDLTVIMRKIFKNEPQRRGEIKALADALIKSMGDLRGGLGDIFSVYGQSTNLADEIPVQHIISETLKDRDLIDRITPILWRILRDKKFADVISFTGRLAANGDLEKLVQFMVDLFRSSQAPALPQGRVLETYHAPSGNVTAMAASARSGPPHYPPRDQYKDCLALSGSLFDFKGQNLYFALRCANANGTATELSALADHLKSANVLEDVSELLRSMIVRSPYTLGALNELEKLFRGGDLDSVLKLFALSGDGPYQIPYRLDGILYDLFRHKGMPSTLKLAGHVAQLPHLAQAGSAAIDIMTTKPHKVFHSDNNFRLKIYDPAALKTQIAKLLPDATPQEVEQAYEVAAENFMTHNDQWKYTEGSYPKQTDDQWKAEVTGFLADLLRTTDLKEFVHALQDVGQNMEPARFLREAIEDQRAVLEHDDDGTPRIHILNVLDQLEELTVASDFHFSVIGFDVGHVGTKFQLSVVKASDLSAEMHHQHSLTTTGKNVAEFLHKHRETNHFKNMLANFDGLQKIADNGDLRIFQRLYRALYDATPQQHRDKADAVLNHMGVLNRTNRLQVFALLTQGLESAKAQGQLEKIVNGMMGMTLLITDKDIEPLRQVLQSLLTSVKKGDPAPLQVLLDKLLAVPQNPAGYQEFKDTLFHIVPAMNRLNVEPTALLQGLPALLSQPRSWSDLIDSFLADAQDQDGGTLKAGANMMNVDEDTMTAFREIATLVMSDDADGNTDLPAAMAMVSDGYAFRPDEYSQLWGSFKAYENDPRVTAFHPPELFKSILKKLDGQSGLGDAAAYILLTDSVQQRLIRTGYFVSKNNDFAALFKILVRAINNGDVDSALHFVFDNLGSSSLRYQEKGPQFGSKPRR